jgi:hypothetical protein
LDVKTPGGQFAVAPYTSSQYPEGTSITLAPNPDPGWTFGSWSADVTGTNSSITVIMNSDKHLTAYYVPPPPPPVALIRLAGNSVVIEWPGSGILRYAPKITGPWFDIYSDASPYETNNAAAMSFYRLRSGN